MQRAAFLLPSFLVIVGMLVSPRAEAQSLEVSKEIHRQQPWRPDTQRPRWVNRADCLAGDVYTFSVGLRDYDDDTLQVWAGDRGVDCAEKGNRGTDSECWLVFAAEADSQTMSVDISAVDLVARESATKRGAEASVVHGSTDACTDSSASKGVPLGLHFMLVDSAGTVAGDPQVLTDIGYDVVPPAAPAKVTASAGETRIFVDWKAPKATDVRSYVFYCDSDTTAVKETRRATPLRPETSVDAADGETATDDAGADIEDEKTTDESDDGGTAGACAPWSVLLPGTDPVSPRSLERYVCGSAGGDDHSTVIDHLKNDVHYVVAVAAADDTGNVSVLSSQACETPVDLTDFFELYRAAGGKGGGNLCSISRPASAPASGWHLGAEVFALAVAAVRRTSRRRRPQLDDSAVRLNRARVSAKLRR